ncbi:hypothetical protein BO79DRAFT_253229 [Aspergillus costaricaensis CBS 115574]|uniref:Uncharacterized protein n=1 Tax=Aspergillus costaricaensis CBS 115574 TaxID=1448317 RepID=A0ACD1IJM8_9EURO|nr:hypothetical protein BO79DRAFT_253229 [Aspergillus costaricaensis CBS 115574]RAK90449.1 hypothetical protein BO79DRAFT_253229 [Aspergillus costaricaensis CBS 115574]
MVDDRILAETEGSFDSVTTKYGPIASMTRNQFFALLAHYCNPHQEVWDADAAQLAFGSSLSIRDNRDNAMFLSQPLLRRLMLEVPSSATAAGQDSSGHFHHRKMFLESKTLDEGREIVRKALLDKMTRSFRLIPEDGEADVDAPLHTYRVESLLAVELCNWISREFQADVTVMEVMGGATVAMMGMMVAGRSKLAHPQWL